MKGQRRDQTHKNPRLIIPSLALGNHTTFAFQILRMKQEEVMRIEMEMKEALQEEQLRNQETAAYRPCIHHILTMYNPWAACVFEMCLSRLERCQEVMRSPFLQEIRDMLQETEKTSNLMAIKEKDMQDQGVNAIRYQEYVMQAQVGGSIKDRATALMASD